jgi:hypothetical protein
LTSPDARIGRNARFPALFRAPEQAAPRAFACTTIPAASDQARLDHCDTES